MRDRRPRHRRAGLPLPGADETSALARATDWSSTPLGDPSTWGPELSAAIRTVVPAGIPMLLWWGPELVQVYNDAYRPICGAKHPRSMGQPAAECWPEAWAELGPRVARVVATGESDHEEALLLFLERHGYVEETYWRYSFSAVRSATGEVLGVFVATTEVTATRIDGYRLTAVRELAVLSSADLVSAEGLVQRVEPVLAGDRRAVPFAAVHLVDAAGDLVRAGSHGLLDGGSALPQHVAGDADHPLARTASARTSRTVHTVDGELTAEPSPLGPLAPTDLVHVPLGRPDGRVEGVLSVGLDPYRPFDEAYDTFVTLLARQLTALLTDVRAAAEERARTGNLEVALRTNRTIGTAVGVLMASRRLSADEAFDRLRSASSTSNRKLREVAEDVVLTGQLPG
ncbi:ANTAR domain-containing protein [Phycicoccus sp. HDW14]|uniref:ANTAR domain-containing protein n=1 Tax=Phycicoccus sp. HDW14 TaxID=2714941 RepID=UPI001409E5FA|nr:ANTAR domain-containing protein [Phycicoccus sp. HDW14]QIM21885.1 ANTAR domain-containing protein [Phycicoccus sp. HDW14]